MASGKKILLGLGIGCGVIVLIVGGSCVGMYYWGKSKVKEATAEMEKSSGGKAALEAMKQGATRGEGGLTGAVAGLAGAGIGASVSMLSVQVVPSLPASEQAEANAAFKAFAEHSAKMKTEDMDALSKAMERYNAAIKPAMEAKSKALEDEQDPARKMQLALEMSKVDPGAARQFVADLKAITARLQ